MLAAVQQQGEGAPHTAVAVVARWFVNIIVLPIAITFEKQSSTSVFMTFMYKIHLVAHIKLQKKRPAKHRTVYLHAAPRQEYMSRVNLASCATIAGSSFAKAV